MSAAGLAAIRSAFAPLVGATVPEALIPLDEAVMLEPDDASKRAAAELGIEAPRREARKHRVFPAYKVPADRVLMRTRIREDERGGGRVIETIDIPTFVALFGDLFAAGKPSLAAFTTACEDVQDVFDEQGVKTGTRRVCRGFCRIAREQEWVAKGILAGGATTRSSRSATSRARTSKR